MDACHIVNEFRNQNRRVVSISKKTKVGMDGLMIEIAKLMTTHPDDSFVTDYNNVRFITGMSNTEWECGMKDKLPECFKDKVFHHGKLKHANLKHLRNALIIIDEIDTGDGEGQKLHSTLNEAGLLDADYMRDHNIRFVFASATMIHEKHDLLAWGELHCTYAMTIPSNYIGHNDFIEREIIKEFYPLDTISNATTWIQEDILEHYRDEYRVHFVRVNKKSVSIIQNACISQKIEFRNHTSNDKLTIEDKEELFEKPLTKHIVVLVKGLLRRANLIPNSWKLRIGAMHELYTNPVDNTVQIQGLIGRMTGYWKDVIIAGHKTGPYRTSIDAVKEYEHAYDNPTEQTTYHSRKYVHENGMVKKSRPTMVSAHNIANLEPVPSYTTSTRPSIDVERVMFTYDPIHNSPEEFHEKSVRKYIAQLKINNHAFAFYGPRSLNPNDKNTDGFYPQFIRRTRGAVLSLDAIKYEKKYGIGANGSFRRFVCYRDTSNKDTVVFILIHKKCTNYLELTPQQLEATYAERLH